MLRKAQQRASHNCPNIPGSSEGSVRSASVFRHLDVRKPAVTGQRDKSKLISVRGALERLLFAYDHQAACSAVGLDMDDVRALLVAKRLYALRARCDSSAGLPASMGRLIELYAPVIEAASGAVIVMTSGVDLIRLNDAGAAWRTLSDQTSRDFKSIYATCTHPRFGRGLELVVLLAVSPRQTQISGARGHPVRTYLDTKNRNFWAA